MKMAKRKPVSIRDVARESNASLTTVSLVLNKRDGRISAATRARVLDAVDKLGYVPNRLAQSLQAQKSGFLAILVPELRHVFADPYFGELISAIEETANAAGYKLLLEVAHKKDIEQNRHVELFQRRFVDGLLCLGSTNRDEFLEDFVGTEHAVIIVNNHLPLMSLNSVMCDYRQAGVLAAEHLIDLGHKEIAYIHGAAEVQTSSDLREGFEKRLAASGIKLPARRAADGLYTEEGGAAAAVKLMKDHPDLTAIMAGNDKMAIGAITGLKRAGLKVPRDVSVVGCDDIHPSEYSDPPLTTVNTPLDEVGHHACNAVLALFEGKQENVNETLPVSLTIRQSTCGPRKIR